MFDKIDNGKWWDKGLQLVEGCTKVSEGCENCWSLSMERRFGKPARVIFHHTRLNVPGKRKKPTVYAIWNDLFHSAITDEQIDLVMQMIKECPWHLFLVLTKRPGRALEYFRARNIKGWNRQHNLWIGVTVENQNMAMLRIPLLLQMPSDKIFVSVEPMLEKISLTSLPELHIAGRIRKNVLRGVQWYEDMDDSRSDTPCRRIDWVIVGAETGHRHRPMNEDWVISLYFECRSNNIPFFYKQAFRGEKKITAPPLPFEGGKQYIEIPEI